jgi:4-carboxymuconolactone decarboxylase
LPQILDRNLLPEDKRDAFDYLIQTRGAVRLPFSPLLHSPDVTQRVAHVGTYVRFESGLPANVRELAVLTAAREHAVAFEWAAHVRAAPEAGVSEAAIEVIGRRGDPASLSDEEALPIRFARALLIDHRLPDAVFEAARQRYGDKGVIDLAATVGYYGMLGALFNALAIEPPPDAPRLPA